VRRNHYIHRRLPVAARDSGETLRQFNVWIEGPLHRHAAREL